MHKFGFETEIDDALTLMPLGVRRKLDIAGLKFPLQTWQALSFQQRCALCEAEVDSIGAENYAKLVREVAEGCPGQLEALPALPTPRPWATQEAKARVLSRSEAEGRPVTSEEWAKLNDERRYILWRLSEARRGPQKLLAALEELLGGPP